MERTRLSFHCWLYSLCIVVYVTNKTWNLKTWNLNANKAVHIILSVVIHKTSINSKQEPLILHVNQESLSLYSLNPDL